MKVELKPIRTRFRAYQLGEPGSSFSYFADEHFTLIEAKLTDLSYASIKNELNECEKTGIDTLHITGWDKDHCDCEELREILAELRPRRVEYPGYEHKSDNYEKCLREIRSYRVSMSRVMRSVAAVRIDPPYLKSLEPAKGIGYTDILFHPKEEFSSSNDNSTVKLFRAGMFNVASLGDVESANIGSMLRMSRHFREEVDILILAHHGANNDINSRRFFEIVGPAVAVCSSNFGNHYDHPRDEVRQSLFDAKVQLVTTKTGDVLIESLPGHRKEYVVINFNGNNSDVSSMNKYVSKKFELLRMNADTLRDKRSPGFKGLKK